LLVARAARGSMPRAIVGHRAFDRKESPVMVGDNQKERQGRISVGHGRDFGSGMS
jgi:hypothetical protein